MYSHFLRLLVFVFVLFCYSAGSSTFVLAQDSPVETGVSPQVGAPGSEFSFYATGFRASDLVVYWFNAPDGHILGNPYRYRTFAHQGRADWTWRAPDHAIPGTWTVVARSLRSDTHDYVQRVIEFDVATIPTSSDDVAQPVPASDQGYAVLPESGIPGTRFSFYATDFDSNERVSYWFNAPDGQIYGDEVNYVVHAYDGRADWRWTSPSDAMPGTWTSVALGLRSGVRRIIAFTVTTAESGVGNSYESNPPDVSVEPAVGKPGSRFFFSADGFLERETVYFWVSDPQGVSYRKSKYKVRPNVDGTVYWNWRTPDEAPRGVWRMIVMGQESQVQKVIYFEVR